MSGLTGLVLIVSLESELRFAACGRNREHLKQHEYRLGYCSLVASLKSDQLFVLALTTAPRTLASIPDPTSTLQGVWVRDSLIFSCAWERG